MHFVPGFISVTPIGFRELQLQSPSDSVTLDFNGLSDAKTEGKKVKERKHFLPFSLVDIIMQGEFTSLLLYFSFFIEKC